VVGVCAIKEAITMAREFGLGLVSAKRSTHFGMAASTCCQRSTQASWRSCSPMLRPRCLGRQGRAPGLNPFAVGAPGGKHGPFLLDMSPAVAARGKIRRAGGAALG
jgi:LDH2 family malate/lactate/ureidoglycolate dehydrogenase